jgi:hypothetical protein
VCEQNGNITKEKDNQKLNWKILELKVKLKRIIHFRKSNKLNRQMKLLAYVFDHKMHKDVILWPPSTTEKGCYRVMALGLICYKTINY